MRIKSYFVSLESNYELESKQTTKLVRLPNNPEPASNNSPLKFIQDSLKLSDQAKKTLQNSIKNHKTVTPEMLDDLEGTKGSVLESLLYWLFGVKVDKVQVQNPKSPELTINFSFSLNQQQINQITQNAGGQWNYVSYQEKESLSFAASGIIETTDGQKIQFSTQMDIQQEFSGEYLQKIDPLVINYSSKLPEFSDNYDKFDINNDGQKEEIATLKEGSGFLALDANRDGKINDGSELFGTKSGNGFKDLALFDEDGNGWIDEGDNVFGQLKIWAKDGAGVDHLYTLAEKGIGAIYLNSVNAPYHMQNGDSTAAVVRRAGIYLKENGTSGTIQQIDLVVK